MQRLSAATGVYGTYGFTYDKDGNRLTQTLGGVTTTYNYGTGNDLLQTISMGGVTTQTLGYTDDGRMATLDPGIESPGSQLITSLSYNQAARFAAVNAGSSTLAGYTYDGFGQRLLKSISSTSGEMYQYGQNGMLLEETDQSGAAQADYIYLNGRPIADLNPSSGTLYYLHDDILGTPQLATDSSQTTQWQATYEPFGQASVSGTITQNLRLPGQYFDSESGWNHNGFRNYLSDLGRYAEPDPLALLGSARFYNPRTGRFMSEEPVRSGTNPYVYADNDSINLIDPTGLAPGDEYVSLRCAGYRAENDYDPISRRRNREYGGFVYRNADGTYSYTDPSANNGAGIGTADSIPSFWDITIPAGTQRAGWYHTHASFDPAMNGEGNPAPGQPGYNWHNDGNEVMSDNDMDISQQIGPGYLGTPRGTIEEYMPRPGHPHQGRTTVLSGKNCGCH